MLMLISEPINTLRFNEDEVKVRSAGLERNAHHLHISYRADINLRYVMDTLTYRRLWFAYSESNCNIQHRKNTKCKLQDVIQNNNFSQNETREGLLMTDPAVCTVDALIISPVTITMLLYRYSEYISFRELSVNPVSWIAVAQSV
jgi:hypothetical protein